MIVCVSGPSCVGKSAAARTVASVVGVPLRSCGDAVRAAAIALSVPPASLPDDAHRQVDTDTRDWARQRAPSIVEGRFLDSVISPETTAPAALVALTASEECRLARARLRGGNPSFSLDDLRRSDQDDLVFRRRIYGDLVAIAPRHVFDTTGRTLEECADWLRRIVVGEVGA